MSASQIEDLNKEILKNVARHLRPLNDVAATSAAPLPLATPMAFTAAPLLPSTTAAGAKLLAPAAAAGPATSKAAANK